MQPSAARTPVVPAEMARAQTRGILASVIVSSSQRLSRFLRFVVESAIQGRAQEEYALGGIRETQ
jgi:hypothetical protein